MTHLKITRLTATLGATAAAATAVAIGVAAAPSRTAGAATNSAAEVQATERAVLRAAVGGVGPAWTSNASGLSVTKSIAARGAPAT